MASAGPYASLHLAPDRQPRQHPTTRFLQAGCPSCRPTNRIKALKRQDNRMINCKIFCKSGPRSASHLRAESHAISTTVDQQDRHVSFTRICDCPIFAYFSKVRILHILPHKLAFSTAILILFVSITYVYSVSLPRTSSCQQNGTIHVSGPLWRNEMG